MVEAIRRVRRSRKLSALRGPLKTPRIAELASAHGIELVQYDVVNYGPVIVRLLEMANPISVLAGCGIVDRALAQASGGGCLNGHTAMLPGIHGLDASSGRSSGTLRSASPPIWCRMRSTPGRSWLNDTSNSSPGRAEFYPRVEAEQARTLVEATVGIHSGTASLRENDMTKSEFCLAAPARFTEKPSEPMSTSTADAGDAVIVKGLLGPNRPLSDGPLQD